MGVLPQISDPAVGNVHEGALSIVDHQKSQGEDGVQVKSTAGALAKQHGDQKYDSNEGPEARRTTVPSR